MHIFKNNQGIEVAVMEPHDRIEVLTEGGGEVLTKQSMAESCDINYIMGRYEKTGILPVDVKGEPMFGDFSDGLTYHEAMNRVLAAQNEFLKMPANLRAKFDNDPGKFMDFVNNPENIDEMIKLGLAVKREPETKPAKPAEGSGSDDVKKN